MPISSLILNAKERMRCPKLKLFLDANQQLFEEFFLVQRGSRQDLLQTDGREVLLNKLKSTNFTKFTNICFGIQRFLANPPPDLADYNWNTRVEALNAPQNLASWDNVQAQVLPLVPNPQGPLLITSPDGTTNNANAVRAMAKGCFAETIVNGIGESALMAAPSLGLVEENFSACAERLVADWGRIRIVNQGNPNPEDTTSTNLFQSMADQALNNNIHTVTVANTQASINHALQPMCLSRTPFLAGIHKNKVANCLLATREAKKRLALKLDRLNLPQQGQVRPATPILVVWLSNPHNRKIIESKMAQAIYKTLGESNPTEQSIQKAIETSLAPLMQPETVNSLKRTLEDWKLQTDNTDDLMLDAYRNAHFSNIVEKARTECPQLHTLLQDQHLAKQVYDRLTTRPLRNKQTIDQIFNDIKHARTWEACEAATIKLFGRQPARLLDPQIKTFLVEAHFNHMKEVFKGVPQLTDLLEQEAQQIKNNLNNMLPNNAHDANGHDGAAKIDIAINELINTESTTALNRIFTRSQPFILNMGMYNPYIAQIYPDIQLHHAIQRYPFRPEFVKHLQTAESLDAIRNKLGAHPNFNAIKTKLINSLQTSDSWALVSEDMVDIGILPALARGRQRTPEQIEAIKAILLENTLHHLLNELQDYPHLCAAIKAEPQKVTQVIEEALQKKGWTNADGQQYDHLFDLLKSGDMIDGHLEHNNLNDTQDPEPSLVEKIKRHEINEKDIGKKILRSLGLKTPDETCLAISVEYAFQQDRAIQKERYKNHLGLQKLLDGTTPEANYWRGAMEKMTEQYPEESNIRHEYSEILATSTKATDIEEYLEKLTRFSVADYPVTIPNNISNKDVAAYRDKQFNDALQETADDLAQENLRRKQCDLIMIPALRDSFYGDHSLELRDVHPFARDLNNRLLNYAKKIRTMEESDFSFDPWLNDPRRTLDEVWPEDTPSSITDHFNGNIKANPHTRKLLQSLRLRYKIIENRSHFSSDLKLFANALLALPYNILREFADDDVEEKHDDGGNWVSSSISEEQLEYLHKKFLQSSSRDTFVKSLTNRQRPPQTQALLDDEHQTMFLETVRDNPSLKKSWEDARWATLKSNFNRIFTDEQNDEYICNEPKYFDPIFKKIDEDFKSLAQLQNDIGKVEKNIKEFGKLQEKIKNLEVTASNKQDLQNILRTLNKVEAKLKNAQDLLMGINKNLTKLNELISLNADNITRKFKRRWKKK